MDYIPIHKVNFNQYAYVYGGVLMEERGLGCLKETCVDVWIFFGLMHFSGFECESGYRMKSTFVIVHEAPDFAKSK